MEIILSILLLLFLAGCILCFVLFCVCCKFVISRFNIWVESKAAGLGIGFIDFVRMYFRRLDHKAICASLKILKKAGISAECRELEALVLAGGHLEQVAGAAVAANKAGLELGFQRVAEIDLAGRDVMDAIESHVNPKVLICPMPESGAGGRQMIRAVSKDGVELGVSAQVTVKTRLDKLVGGAGEYTIAARVGEGIISAIGKAESHREILEHPEYIARTILEKGLDTGTCYEIVSMDVSQIEVGENIAVRLKTEQAKADKEVAQAMAAQRRANAAAAQREMSSLTMEKQAGLELAKSVLPESVAAASLSGNMGAPRPPEPLFAAAAKWR